MRICRLLCFLLACLFLGFVVTSAAQEMNFSAGPQYLMTSGSPLFARSLETPSLSLATIPLATVATEPAENAASSPEYQQIEAVLEQQRQMALPSIYYGVPAPNVIDISFGDEESARAALPASITDTGVVNLTDTQVLQMRGYGITLSEAAAYWKSHKGHASRVYTNSDIASPHQ
jgi:hypothetical protein